MSKASKASTASLFIILLTKYPVNYKFLIFILILIIRPIPKIE